MNHSLRIFTRTGIPAALLSLAGLALAHAEEAPQVDVRCGVVYSIFNHPTFGMWTQQVPSGMGSQAWNRMIFLMYAPFVVVKNNSGWPLELYGDQNRNIPLVTFDQPPLQLEFKRIGDSHAGFVTNSPARLNDMYGNQPVARKTFKISLDGGTLVPTGSKTLAPGESCVFTPAVPPSSKFTDVFDWQNNLTSNLHASVGWKGPSNGFFVDYLTGRAGINQDVNGRLVIVPTRIQDSWDVRISGIETAMASGTRIFRGMASVGLTWPIDPEPEAEITHSPYTLSDHRNPIPVTTMKVESVDPISYWQVEPIFSVLLPPTTQSGFITDANSNGMNDGWEKHYFGDTSPSPSADADHDGYSNYFEYLAGTSPLDGTDFIRQSLVTLETGELQIEWSSIPNRTYVVETSGNLKDWTPHTPLTADSTSTSQQLARPATGPLFARIRIVPPTQTRR